MRHFEHAMLGILLAGALGSSVLGQALGWSGAGAGKLPDFVQVVVLVAGATAVSLLPVRQRGESLLVGAAFRLAAIVTAAVVMALVLDHRENTFYTAPSLVDGMIALLVLHLVSRVMRWIAVEYRESFLVIRPLDSGLPPSHRLRRLLFTPQRPRVRALTLPAVALADALASVSAWMLLAFWVLVAMERRHLASAVLVFTCTLLVLECAMLIPDTLAGIGILPRGLDTTPSKARD